MKLGMMDMRRGSRSASHRDCVSGSDPAVGKPQAALATSEAGTDRAIESDPETAEPTLG